LCSSFENTVFLTVVEILVVHKSTYIQIISTGFKPPEKLYQNKHKTSLRCLS